ncbi:uncharacterized protein LOC135615154 isoform X2 [Musa acuminata AAA Group]
MTNEIGKAMFYRAGELGVPVGIMCMKGLSLHISEIEELCENYPSTIVLLDHMGFCKPPMTDEEHNTFSSMQVVLSHFCTNYIMWYIICPLLVAAGHAVTILMISIFNISCQSYWHAQDTFLICNICSIRILISVHIVLEDLTIPF